MNWKKTSSRKEILPVLSKTIEPALQPVKRELVLVVDYVPGQPLSVHLSRKRNFAAELTDAKEMVLDPEVTHRNHLSSSEGKIERGPARDLSVEFPDGTVISEKDCRRNAGCGRAENRVAKSAPSGRRV